MRFVVCWNRNVSVDGPGASLNLALLGLIGEWDPTAAGIRDR